MKMYLPLFMILSFFALQSREYIRVSEANVYEGGKPEYYKGYHAMRMADEKVIFPFDCCDFLPYCMTGQLRFFFTSAIELHLAGLRPVRLGQAILITNPDINQIVVVRGRGSYCGHDVVYHTYIGFDANCHERQGSCRIADGTILCVIRWDKARRGAYQGVRHDRVDISYLCDAQVFDIHALTDYVREYTGIQAYCWSNPEFIETAKRLFCHDEGAYLGEGCFANSIKYWTDTENKLKAITYFTK